MKTSKATAFSPTTPPWIGLPSLGWLLWFLLIPCTFIFVYSFLTKGTYGGIVYLFTWENYHRATDLIYLQIFWNSLKLALLTALSCLLIGYPMAYVMATTTKAKRSLLLMLVVIPFWTNFVVRAYAVKLFLADQGPLNQLLLFFHLRTQPIPFLDSYFSVWLGMVTNYLPFMVLPLFVALEKFDFTLIEAARDLGADGTRSTLRVLLPLTKPGIITGFLLVFTPALGEFVIPDLFGGARTLLIGSLITEQFLKSRDWPFGAALSMILMLTVMVCLFVYLKFSEREVKRHG